MTGCRMCFGAILILAALAPLSVPPAPTPVVCCPVKKKPILRTPETEVITLVNNERAKRGLNTLRVNQTLTANAEKWSMVQAKTRMHHSRMPGVGENVAKGYKTPDQVMDAWMRSRGHRKNILSPNYSEIGVGYALANNSGPAWTQQFR